MWCTLRGELTHGARQITSSFRSVCGSTFEAFFTSLATRTQSLHVLHWDAIVLSSSSNNDEDDGGDDYDGDGDCDGCLLYTSPSPRDRQKSRMPSSA